MHATRALGSDLLGSLRFGRINLVRGTMPTRNQLFPALLVTAAVIAGCSTSEDPDVPIISSQSTTFTDAQGNVWTLLNGIDYINGVAVGSDTKKLFRWADYVFAITNSYGA